MSDDIDNIKEHSYHKEGYHVGPFGRLFSDYPRGFFDPIADIFIALYDKPVTWFHDKVVVPNRKQSVYYHYKFKRVPTADECYVDDYACIYEADQQYKRDRTVDRYIIKLLDKRLDECMAHYGGLGLGGGSLRFPLSDGPGLDWCQGLQEDVKQAERNYMVKYGELKFDGSGRLNLNEAKTRAYDVYLKQKHRYIWERRQAMRAQEAKAKEVSNEAS